MRYLLTPDVNAPLGGIRHIYRIVDSLNAQGMPAAVFHGAPGFRCTWFENRTRVRGRRALHLEPGDTLVIPEVVPSAYSRIAPGVPVVVLNQNHFYTFGGADWDAVPAGPYPGIPTAVAAVATSDAIEAFLRAVTPPAFPIHRVPYVIDPEVFSPGPKSRSIAVMPRKRPADAVMLRQLIRRSERLRGWDVVVLDGLDHRAVAERLRSSALFVSLSDREGFGLPPAEAMAAGCHVVGFSGCGGEEFMRSGHCTLVDDPDLLALARGLEAAADAFDRDPAAFAAGGAQAAAFIHGRYSPGAFDEAVVRTFAALEAPGSPAVLTSRCRVRHLSGLSRLGEVKVHIRGAQTAARGLRRRR